MRGKAAQQATHVCVIIIHACRFPTIFHSIVGKDEQEQNSPSWFNAQEAKLVIKYVEVGAVRQQAGQASRCRPWAGSQAGKLASWQRQTNRQRQAGSQLGATTAPRPMCVLCPPHTPAGADVHPAQPCDRQPDLRHHSLQAPGAAHPHTADSQGLRLCPGGLGRARGGWTGRCGGCGSFEHMRSSTLH